MFRQDSLRNKSVNIERIERNERTGTTSTRSIRRRIVQIFFSFAFNHETKRRPRKINYLINKIITINNFEFIKKKTIITNVLKKIYTKKMKLIIRENVRGVRNRGHRPTT